MKFSRVLGAHALLSSVAASVLPIQEDAINSQLSPRGTFDGVGGGLIGLTGLIRDLIDHKSNAYVSSNS